MALKGRQCAAESRQKSKNMREAMREQKQRSRQLIVACARKMQEQEAEIEQVGHFSKPFHLPHLLLRWDWCSQVLKPLKKVGDSAGG